MAGKINQAYTHPLRDMHQELGVPTLLSHAELVEQVVQHPGWALVTRCIEAASERLTSQLLNPSIQDLPRYAALTAELRGLRSMQEAAETILAYAAEAQATAERASAAQE